MHMSKMGYIQLANREALALTKYIDSGGVQTIGIGMTVSEIKDIKQWPWNKELSIKEAAEKYRISLQRYVNAVDLAIQVPVSQSLFDACCSLCYNIGTHGFEASTLVRRINNNEGLDAYAKEFKKWVNDNGKRVQGLVNRRNKEIEMFMHDKYEFKDGCVGLIYVNPSTHKPVYTSTRVSIEEYL